MNINATNFWIYAYLSELAYRRADTDFGATLAGLNASQGGFVNAFNENTEGGIENTLNTYLQDSGLADTLAFDFSVSEQNGVFHIYNEFGFSAFVLQNGSDFTITFRGSDISGAASIGIVELGLSAGADLFLGPFDPNDVDGGNDQNIDEGDSYTNVNFSSARYNETQYDYALALTRFVQENLAINAGDTITLTGQSLGAGLATLIGVELGVEQDEKQGTNLGFEVASFGTAPFANFLRNIAQKNAVVQILEENPDLFDAESAFLT